MKKGILFLIISLLISSSTEAQYRINKQKYDYRTYSFQPGDPYNVNLAGIASYLIPGLGQMISGEDNRGLFFLGGFLACGTVSIVGTQIESYDTEPWEPREYGNNEVIIAGLIGVVIVDLWSIIDAVKVAKVNNLAYRDQNKTSLNLQLQPYINLTYYAQNALIPIGLTLKVKF